MGNSKLCFEKEYQKNRIQVLWISYCAPYDTVPHAGGKIHNYYLKGLNRDDRFDITVITVGKPEDVDKIDLKAYGIRYELLIDPYNGPNFSVEHIKRKLHRWNFLSRDAGFITPFAKKNIVNCINRIDLSYTPGVIILQWTQVILLLPEIKKRFPDIPVIAIEEDVSYISNKRKSEIEKNGIKRWFRKKLYYALKKKEIEMLEKCSLTICNNFKDEKLIKKENPSINTYVWCPYFQTMSDLVHIGGTKDILFYGAMSRQENWQSAIWFIENVFPRLRREMRFVVVGNHPPKELVKYSSDRVIITGFVDDVSPYFINSLCLVAPLLLGAGIKIKVLEALSSGIPVLTNDVGIEGIDAVDRKHYFLCSSPHDYIHIINDLSDGKINVNNMANESKRFIENKYNLTQSLNRFCEIVAKVAKRDNKDCDVSKGIK